MKNLSAISDRTRKHRLKMYIDSVTIDLQVYGELEVQVCDEQNQWN